MKALTSSQLHSFFLLATFLPRGLTITIVPLIPLAMAKRADTETAWASSTSSSVSTHSFERDIGHIMEQLPGLDISTVKPSKHTRAYHPVM